MKDVDSQVILERLVRDIDTQSSPAANEYNKADSENIMESPC